MSIPVYAETRAMCGKRTILGKTALLLLLIWAWLPAKVYSHPHLFIDAAVVFQTRQETVTGIRYTWVFDDMFSRLVLTDYDIDKDQKLSEREISRIKKDIFDNLAHYNFFTHIEDLRFQTVLDFTVTVQACRLTVEDLAAVFSPENVRRLKEYLNQNQYIDDDNQFLETYPGLGERIQKWMCSNLGKDAEPMIKYLEFSTGKRMVYSFVLPLSRPVPCPGATLILAFSISIDSMGFGILSVLSMTLGMMMTVSLISLAVILGKNSFLSPFSRRRSAYMAVQKCFSLGGAVLMIAFSSAFLLGSLL